MVFRIPVAGFTSRPREPVFQAREEVVKRPRRSIFLSIRHLFAPRNPSRLISWYYDYTGLHETRASLKKIEVVSLATNSKSDVPFLSEMIF